MLQAIKDNLPEEEFMIADGFDKAIIGYDDNSSPLRIIYSVRKCIDILVNEHDMSEEDALEYFNYNCSSAYMGDGTPIWCQDLLGNEK